MKAQIVLTTCLILRFADGSAQSFFSITPDLDGDEMEGMAFNVIPIKEGIKVIGLVHDSLVPGFEGGNWPVLASISYDGEFLGTQYLVDSLYSDGFIYITRGIAFKNDSICYLYDRRDIGNMFLDAYLVEMNYLEGTVLRSKIVTDEIMNNEDFAATVMTVEANSNLYLVNISFAQSSFSAILTVLDSVFNVLSQSVIPSFGRMNIPNYIHKDDFDNIVIVGMSLGVPTAVWWESKLYKQVLDSNLMSVEFTMAPTAFDQSIILADHYPVIKAQNGNWVIASQRVVETLDCQDCTNGIPFVVGISDDFSEVLWETKMFDGNEFSSLPLYWASSITEVSDGYIFAGSTDGMIGMEVGGILGKVGLNGDSLWLKHYIPVGWDTTQALWVDLKDIKTTPQGNIVACGRAYDRYNMIRVPWILHLDSDGCLEPGCNTVSTSDVVRDVDVELRIFPNPAQARTIVHIRSHHPGALRYTLRILDSRGVQIRSFEVPGRDVQYMIDLEDWPAGTYFAQLMEESGRQVTKQFVVLE